MKENAPSIMNPKFGIIAPTQYLERYSTQSDFHLVLAHLVDTDDEYANFYAKMSERGDFIICDNGAFELGESYAPDKLIELGKKCKADAIVLPDYPFQPAQKTIDAFDALKDQVMDAGFQTMFVPQSERGDLEDWIEGYEWAVEDDDIDIIGMSILGIPNALPHIPKAYARVVMTQILIDRNIIDFHKHHHYLGLNAGPALELPTLLQLGALHSCDSSNPVWMGILGHEYSHNTDSFLSVKKVHMPVQFDLPISKDQATLDRIQHNIDMTLELFEYAKNH